MDALLRKRPRLALLGWFPPIYLIGLVLNLVFGVTVSVITSLGDRAWIDLRGDELIRALWRLLIWPTEVYRSYRDV